MVSAFYFDDRKTRGPDYVISLNKFEYIMEQCIYKEVIT